MIKDKHFEFEVEKENKIQFDNTEQSGVKPVVIKDDGKNVIFDIYPFYPWGKIDMTIKRLWVKGDPNKQNILSSEFEIKNTNS